MRIDTLHEDLEQGAIDHIDGKLEALLGQIRERDRWVLLLYFLQVQNYFLLKTISFLFKTTFLFRGYELRPLNLFRNLKDQGYGDDLQSALRVLDNLLVTMDQIDDLHYDISSVKALVGDNPRASQRQVHIPSL